MYWLCSSKNLLIFSLLRGSLPPPSIDNWERNENLSFWNDPLFFTQRLPKLLSCFFCALQLAYTISTNFHCDAIIFVVKLFWCVTLEPMINSKCKPGQSQWALLKLESCCDVIKRLFSTAMAGQDNVLAQIAFLEENGCNAGRSSTCNVIILS